MNMAAGDRLLDASGNVILDDDGNVQLSDGAGDSCCCGCACAYCGDSTPEAWTVTVSGVSFCTCFSILGGEYGKVSGVLDGTYTADRSILCDAVSGDCCFWQFFSAINSDLLSEYYSDSGCTSPVQGQFVLVIEVRKLPGLLSCQIYSTIPLHPDLIFFLFKGTVSTDNCADGTKTINNDFVSGNCGFEDALTIPDCTDATDTFQAAYDGTAQLTAA